MSSRDAPDRPCYEPAWRRPIAGGFRRSADFAVRWCVRRGVHPNTVSWMSLVSASAAGACFLGARQWPLLLLLAPLFCWLRLWFNMLDGMVALASKKASRTGEIVNELPDRISDVVILVSAGYSGWCDPAGGYWAAIFALLTAYVGTLGQAIGVQREFRGVMSKPWRMVAIGAGAWLALLVAVVDGAPAGAISLLRGDSFTVSRFGGLTILDWTMIVIVAGCVQTVIVRLARIVRAVRAKD
ncbi:MAG: CDP-alcohol phosphatidyltransferase family protein [Phycisphaerae bacterium]|nr:CDP-alcohol phosphatidyltransferase family protein [Phycisphaerae bacterium]